MRQDAASSCQAIGALWQNMDAKARGIPDSKRDYEADLQASGAWRPHNCEATELLENVRVHQDGSITVTNTTTLFDMMQPGHLDQDSEFVEKHFGEQPDIAKPDFDLSNIACGVVGRTVQELDPYVQAEQDMYLAELERMYLAELERIRRQVNGQRPDVQEQWASSTPEQRERTRSAYSSNGRGSGFSTSPSESRLSPQDTEIILERHTASTQGARARAAALEASASGTGTVRSKL